MWPKFDVKRTKSLGIYNWIILLKLVLKEDITKYSKICHFVIGIISIDQKKLKHVSNECVMLDFKTILKTRQSLPLENSIFTKCPLSAISFLYIFYFLNQLLTFN